MSKQITIRIVYRNYKPIHKIYESLADNPPAGVRYIIPKPITSINRFKFIHRKFRHTFVFKSSAGFINKYVFSKGGDKRDFDIYHIINMLPQSLDKNKPYILEAEHASSLTGFSNDEKLIKKAKQFLLDSQCKAIICMSQATVRTFKELMGPDYEQVKDKIEIVYPAIACPDVSARDNSVINSRDKLNLLFVGEDSLRKGIVELVGAVSRLNRTYKDRIELYVVASDAKPVVESYKLKNVHLLPPKFSKKEILEKLFLPADVLILPTRMDTFGMVIIDSMAAGTPVIATNQFAIPELVDEDKDGFLVKLENAVLDRKLFRTDDDRRRIRSTRENKKVSSELADKIKIFLEQPGLAQKMGETARKKFAFGKFSISARNKKLSKIYKEALS